jgi:hypothetical protein
VHGRVALPDFADGTHATTAGGEIFVLDSANYGPVSINRAITIASDGAVGGVLATSGAGLTIAAGAGDVVYLRGLASMAAIPAAWASRSPPGWD